MRKKDGIGSLIFGHAIAFLFCVLFPGLVTAIAPVAWIKFERTGEHVAAQIEVCAFFVVPYQMKRIDPVVGIGDQFIAGKETPRRHNNERGVRSEDEAFLVIHGNDDSAKAPVSPIDIKSVTQRAAAFLADPKATELKMFTVANWKFSVFGGGLVCLLTLLYVFGIVMSITRFPFRMLGLLHGSKDDPFERQPSERI